MIYIRINGVARFTYDPVEDVLDGVITAHHITQEGVTQAEFPITVDNFSGWSP